MHQSLLQQNAFTVVCRRLYASQPGRFTAGTLMVPSAAPKEESGLWIPFFFLCKDLGLLGISRRAKSKGLGFSHWCASDDLQIMPLGQSEASYSHDITVDSSRQKLI